MILSDMCPAVSGITTKDTAISCELGMRALSLAVGRVHQPSSANNTGLEDYLSSSEPDANEDGVLQRGGNLVIKLLESEDIQGYYSSWNANSDCYSVHVAVAAASTLTSRSDFIIVRMVSGFGKFCKLRFRKVSCLRPKATRSSSREIYLICQGLR